MTKIRNFFENSSLAGTETNKATSPQILGAIAGYFVISLIVILL